MAGVLPPPSGDTHGASEVVGAGGTEGTGETQNVGEAGLPDDAVPAREGGE